MKNLEQPLLFLIEHYLVKFGILTICCECSKSIFFRKKLPKEYLDAKNEIDPLTKRPPVCCCHCWEAIYSDMNTFVEDIISDWNESKWKELERSA